MLRASKISGGVYHSTDLFTRDSWLNPLLIVFLNMGAGSKLTPWKRSRVLSAEPTRRSLAQPTNKWTVWLYEVRGGTAVRNHEKGTATKVCKSKTDGGQRCAAHTRPAYLAATFGTSEWDDAAANYASTPEGQRVLEDLAEQNAATNNVDHEMRTRSAIERGRLIRDINTATATLINQQTTTNIPEPEPPHTEPAEPQEIGTAYVEDNWGDCREVTPGQMTDEVRWIYRNGQCLALAVTLAERTQWPIVAHTCTYDNEDYDPDVDPEEYATYESLVHAYVQHPNGTLVDIWGENDPHSIELSEDETLTTYTSDDAKSMFEDYIVPQDYDTAASFHPHVFAGINASDLTAQEAVLAVSDYETQARYTLGDCHLLAHAVAEQNG